ncbi:MAG: PIN domain-containing protein [Aquificae bacterium]|nr:PIN domain-containing protein [Aquificota bacterium]
MKIRGRSIFVDTSALILFLHGSCNDITLEIFKLALEKKCKLITSSRCVDEFIFKEMVLIAKDKYGFRSKTISKLRRHPKIVMEIGKKLTNVIPQFIKAYHIEILEVKKEWVLKLPELMQQYGLFGNDALIIRAMQSRNIEYLLSSDQDFKRIPFIKMIDAL